MSNKQCHIIKRQILEVEVGSPGNNGQAIQQRLSEVYQARVIPAMEMTLNRISDRDRRISIDRLEINLGEFSLDDLDEKFSQRVVEQLFRVIREKLYTYNLQKELATQGISTRTEDTGNLVIKTSVAAKADFLAGFLKTGRIPWTAGIQASSKPVSVLVEELLEEAPSDMAVLLKRELRHSLQKTRFIYQMPDPLIQKAVAICIEPGSAASGKRTPAGILGGFAAGTIKILNRRELPVRWDMSALRTRIWGLVIDRTLLQSGGSSRISTEKMIHDLLDRLIFGRGESAPTLPQPQRFLKLLADELPSTSAVRESGFAGRLPAVLQRYADLNRQQWRRQEDTGPGGDADVLAETKHGMEAADREIGGRTNIEKPDDGKGETSQTADEKRKGDREKGSSAEESDSPDLSHDSRKSDRPEGARTDTGEFEDIPGSGEQSESDKESDSLDTGPASSATDADGKAVPDPAGLECAKEEWEPDARRERDGSTVRDGYEPGEKGGAPDLSDDTCDSRERQRPDQAEKGKTGTVDSPDLPNYSRKSDRPKAGGTDTGEFEDLPGSGEQSESEDTGGPSGDATRDKWSAGEEGRNVPENEEGRPGAWDDEKLKQEERERPQAGEDSFEADSPSAEFHRSYNIREKADEAWIQNAGQVLLHPFLVQFFDQAGLVKDKQFVSQDARVRAVHLLQYIVTGEQETPEQELFLNKLLCGLEPEYPVPSGIKLTQQEKEESENVLESVVGHWKALKNSSPESVRTTFLRREGLVSREGMIGVWKVTIERNTFDVLLSRLPWGLSMIKMPWNSYLIHVEW